MKVQNPNNKLGLVFLVLGIALSRLGSSSWFEKILTNQKMSISQIDTIMIVILFGASILLGMSIVLNINLIMSKRKVCK